MSMSRVLIENKTMDMTEGRIYGGNEGTEWWVFLRRE
jgi:hypothetical protein